MLFMVIESYCMVVTQPMVHSVLDIWGNTRVPVFSQA